MSVMDPIRCHSDYKYAGHCIVSRSEALERARKLELDLVEVNLFNHVTMPLFLYINDFVFLFSYITKQGGFFMSLSPSFLLWYF